MSAPSNVVLIGMPGSGKSTVGVLLAKEASLGFIDTDLCIQTRGGCSLQDVVDSQGSDALRQLEESVLLDLKVHNHVISTGGSAVYSDRAMQSLKRDGLVVFLDVDLPTLEGRITNYATRGLAKRPEQTMAELFAERLVLYQRYADHTVDCSQLTLDEACAAVLALLR